MLDREFARKRLSVFPFSAGLRLRAFTFYMLHSIGSEADQHLHRAGAGPPVNSFSAKQNARTDDLHEQYQTNLYRPPASLSPVVSQ